MLVEQLTESLQEFTNGVTSITALAKQNETKFSAPSTLPTAVTSTISEKDLNELDSAFCAFNSFF